MSQCEPSLCVPDICVQLGSTGDFCQSEKCQSLSVDQAYTFGYVAVKEAPLLIQGIPNMIQSDVTWYLFRLAIIQALPYVITFIVLFAVLMRSKAISIEAGILLIVLVLVITIVCLVWLAYDTINVVDTIMSQTKTKVLDNWDIYKDQIECDLTQAIIDTDGIKCDGLPCGPGGDDMDETQIDNRLEPNISLNITPATVENRSYTYLI